MHKTRNLNNTTVKSSNLVQIENFLLCSKLNFFSIIYKNPSLERKQYTNNCGFSICDTVLPFQWLQPIFGVDVARIMSLSNVAEYKSRRCQDPQISIAVKFQCRDFRHPPRCRGDLLSSGDVTERRIVIPYRRFGTTHRPHIQGSRSPRKMPVTYLSVTGILHRLLDP